MEEGEEINESQGSLPRENDYNSITELVDSMETAYVGKQNISSQPFIFANMNSYHVKLVKRTSDGYQPVLEYVPCFLVEAFYKLNWKKYTDITGIFRIDGNQQKLRKMDTKPLFFGWQKIDDKLNVHDLCTLVKRFFREIEDPILEGQQQHILQFASNENPPKAMRQALSVILHSLGNRKYGALIFTLLQLHNIAQKEAVNSMSYDNLAIVFAPTFFRGTFVSQIPPKSSGKKKKGSDYNTISSSSVEAVKKANETKVRAVKFLIENAYHLAYEEQKGTNKRRLTNGKDVASAIKDMRERDGSVSDCPESNLSSSTDNVFENTPSSSKKYLKYVGHANSEEGSVKDKSVDNSIARILSLNSGTRKSPRSLSEHSLAYNNATDESDEKVRRFQRKGTLKSVKDFGYGKRKSNPSKRSSSVVKVLNSITNLASSASNTMANIWQRRGSGGPLEFALISTPPNQGLNDAFLSPNRKVIRSRSSSQYSHNESLERSSFKKTASSERLFVSPLPLEREPRSGRSSIRRDNVNGITRDIDQVIKATQDEIGSFKYPVDVSIREMNRFKFKKIDLLTKPVEDRSSLIVMNDSNGSDKTSVMLPIITAKINKKGTIRCNKKEILPKEKSDVENQNHITIKDLSIGEGRKRDVALSIDRSRRNTAPVKSMSGKSTIRRNQPNSLQSGLKTPKIMRSNKFLNNENSDDSCEMKSSDDSSSIFKNSLCARSSSFHNGVLSSPDARKPLSVLNMQRNDRIDGYYDNKISLVGLFDRRSLISNSTKIVKRNSSEMSRSKNNDSLDDLIEHKKKFSLDEDDPKYEEENVTVDVDIIQHDVFFSSDVTLPDKSFVTDKCIYSQSEDNITPPLLPKVENNVDKEKVNTPAFENQSFRLSISKEDLQRMAPVTTSPFMSPRESITPDYDCIKWNKTSSLTNSKHSSESFGSILDTSTFLNVNYDSKVVSAKCESTLENDEANSTSSFSGINNKLYSNMISSCIKKPEFTSTPKKNNSNSSNEMLNIFKAPTSEVNRTKTAIQRQSTGTWKETSSPTSFIPNVVNKMFNSIIEKSPMKLIKSTSPSRNKVLESEENKLSDKEKSNEISIKPTSHQIQESLFGAIIDESPKKVVIHLGDNNKFKAPIGLPAPRLLSKTNARRTAKVDDEDFKNSDYMVDQLKNAKNRDEIEAIESPGTKYANTRPSLAVLYKEKCGNNNPCDEPEEKTATSLYSGKVVRPLKQNKNTNGAIIPNKSVMERSGVKSNVNRVRKKEKTISLKAFRQSKPKKLEAGLDGTVKRTAKEMAESFTEFAISKEIKGLKSTFETEFGCAEAKIFPALIKDFLAEKNEKKNRSKLVPCLDKTRVKLCTTGLSDESDYIHANYIPTSRAGDRMILTQAPMSYVTDSPSNGSATFANQNGNTAYDFYRMLDQENTEHVIMLCNFSEEKQSMCYQYIPINVNDTITIGSYKITMLSKEQQEKIVRSEILYVKGDGKPKKYIHYQYLNWPKEGCPEAWDLTPVNLYYKINETQKPIVIHCTSGIRRSGSICAIFMALDELENGTLPNNLASIVRHIRCYRLLAVRTPIEFLYVYLQLIHCFLHKNLIENSQKLLEFFDDYDPAHRKQTAKEKITKCVSDYGITSVRTPTN
uniref:Rho-GAP domain-containing protein n=1 Tax=Parastrongyloides trichosuri TaxID=131310 RepID=A0A0N4ZK56_PARTI